LSAALQLYLIRHGETAWSITGQHTGFTDIALTPHGEEEARALAPHLRTTHFTKILTSPLLRARQTCELAGIGAAGEIDPDLVEWNYAITKASAPWIFTRSAPAGMCGAMAALTVKHPPTYPIAQTGF